MPNCWPRTRGQEPGSHELSESFSGYLAGSAALIEKARQSGLDARAEAAIRRVVDALTRRLPLLVCGNGGSASDAMHIAGELVGRFFLERPGLKVIALVADSAVLTAWSNDYGYETVFSRQVEAYGEAGGVLLGLSTSGNSSNVLRAFEAARERGMTTIALTGEGGGKLAALADILLDVPSRSTPRIQELHICLYHFLCENIEARCAAALAGKSPQPKAAIASP
jgi:D-sedoheptulose 7-phosphate isomerase